MILLIDNYDSFTYNLVQMFEVLNHEVKVFRNNAIGLVEMEKLNPRYLVISPGPGTPEQAGISKEAVRRFGPNIPVLGVCLGHQSIASVFGANIIRAKRIMHGKTSRIENDGKTIFENIDEPFAAVRYHSLIVDKKSLPDCLEISAWTDTGEIMGLRHKAYKIEGVQFHPESILTEYGEKLMKSFLNLGGE